MFYRSYLFFFFLKIHFNLKIKCPKPLNTYSIYIAINIYHRDFQLKII